MPHRKQIVQTISRSTTSVPGYPPWPFDFLKCSSMRYYNNCFNLLEHQMRNVGYDLVNLVVKIEIQLTRGESAAWDLSKSIRQHLSTRIFPPQCVFRRCFSPFLFFSFFHSHLSATKLLSPLSKRGERQRTRGNRNREENGKFIFITLAETAANWSEQFIIPDCFHVCLACLA